MLFLSAAILCPPFSLISHLCSVRLPFSLLYCDKTRVSEKAPTNCLHLCQNMTNGVTKIGLLQCFHHISYQNWSLFHIKPEFQMQKLT